MCILLYAFQSLISSCHVSDMFGIMKDCVQIKILVLTRLTCYSEEIFELISVDCFCSSQKFKCRYTL